MGINSGEMHSDLDQSQRNDVMFKFKGEHIDVLVATDIVARGIDIDDITMVINYDVPHDVEDYVHRIGRTARVNRDGRAITLIRGKEVGYFMKIEKFLGREIEKLSLPPHIGKAPEYKEIKDNKGNKARSGKRRNKTASPNNCKSQNKRSNNKPKKRGNSRQENKMHLTPKSGRKQSKEESIHKPE